MSPPGTFTLTSPTVSPGIGLDRIGAHRAGGKRKARRSRGRRGHEQPRRDTGAIFVKPTMSCILVCMFMSNLLVRVANRKR